MHYVTVAGGNAFYEKRDEDGTLETPPPLPSYEVAMNYVPGQSMLPPQFEVLIPSDVPVPIPSPDPAATASTNPLPIPAATAIEPEPGTPIAIPTPRPAYDSVMLRPGISANGG
jgi:hypothetical protein